MKNSLLTLATFSLLTVSAADPNPYSDYSKAMESDAKSPSAVVWQAANSEAIDAATDEDTLAGFVEDAETADALLAQLRGAYRTDPLILTQIAAVTQWVLTEEPCWLCFWSPSPADGRKVWVAALKRKITASSDPYIRTFCRQQLDLCE